MGNLEFLMVRVGLSTHVWIHMYLYAEDFDNTNRWTWPPVSPLQKKDSSLYFYWFSEFINDMEAPSCGYC